MVSYGGVVNIVTLVIYFIYCCLSFYCAVRHGLGRSTPWICLIVLSLCRLTQVSIDLAATELYPNDAPNTALESGVAILTELALTPLFMATSSLLNTTGRPKGRRMQWLLILLHIPLIVSLILIVAGGIDPDSDIGPTFAATEATKAGVALYCACFVILIWATAVISARLYLANSTEVQILTTVVISMPFFLVDVVYMMCFAFESFWGTQKFNIISGSVTIQLCMQVIMEYIIVGLYLFLGMGLPDKAARLREQVAEMDSDEIASGFLWKMYECLSAVVALTVMPALLFAHWMLGKLLRS
ncbi:hypothetical protein K504DRAFT_378129 [Pleomassaria siparia CBS 279.74]|uniref:DUF7702 domain-containing protein n=1 Tax=Pleomassaria siparia CBS 279.74 TaxID=1314801 RepID=A0A6G1KBN2_9PLEO|nr:hypothetical protein K504DRAFT_378129 [Pleomassaria siparia CBS 279.74]